ncbi:MAG: hypothetical protein IKB05_00425 [Alphaproteobacteria bacterium]|nr:hypothetical protein [Alphaproteobacteria bacterium]
MKTDMVILNGRPIEAVVFGNGQEQIDFFNSVADYANANKWHFFTRIQNSQLPGMLETVVIARSKKYTIRVIETKMPKSYPPFKQYQSYVFDNETSKSKIDYGTISHCFWDLLHELKDKQK